MAYAISPNLCEPCQRIVDSPDFRDAIECLELIEATSNEDLEDYEGPTHIQYLSRTKYSEKPTFKLYGELLSSEKSCALCKLILECRTSIWGDWRLTPDFKPSLKHTTAPDTELIYGIDSSLASIRSCASLFIGTAKAKLALVHISLLNNKRLAENFNALLESACQPLRPTTIRQIRQWLEECTSSEWTTSHHLCMHGETTEEASTNQAQRPKRLIHISDEQTLIIRETVTLPENLRYATLSHCWGSNEEASIWRQTAVSNDGVVDMHRAPQLLVDATTLLRALGIHYIWVDAICIDQGSRTEWLHESVKMGDIYQRGVLNISAIASKNGNEGLFHTQPSEKKIVIPLQQLSGAIPVLLAADPSVQWDRQVKGARLSARGWVLQERLLSPRTLHIGRGEVFWECNSFRAGETTAKIHPAPNDFKSAFSSLGLRNQRLQTSQTAMREQGGKPYPHYRAWDSLVQAYSHMNLSKSSDKLVAIAGIANRFARFLDLPDTSYTAGLWTDDMPRSLLWRVRHGKPFPDRAPSWSWARWDGPISFIPNYLDPSFCTRVTAISQESNNDSFVSAESRSIRLQGPLSVIQFTDERKQQRKLEQRIGRPTRAPNVLSGIPAWSLNWDDRSSKTISADQQYYALYVCERTLDDYWYSSHGLVLTPTGPKRGQFERVGTFEINVRAPVDMSLSESVLAYCEDPSKIPKEMYASFDPDYGFEIELV